ncbi:hypothetical protein BofuT4_uP006770.1 [Botrytis cinerea T4]|uniref:Uncharacterized protein n=1 Tax=Botryotinia fuckeliana (strain T4) TaxID=999810 RepID=G2Y4C8_BOTF4|nr:hypothetical protein BofuT4_uP006770.1 [Botrytis cinerea T4]
MSSNRVQQWRVSTKISRRSFCIGHASDRRNWANSPVHLVWHHKCVNEGRTRDLVMEFMLNRRARMTWWKNSPHGSNQS